MGMYDSLPDAVVRNGDVDWNRWPVEPYLVENYRDLHPADAAVIDHHSAYYRRLAPNSVERSLEFGAGPNLYPLMLAAACSLEIHALDPSSANVAYLNRQLANGPDDSWQPFYSRCRLRNSALPPLLSDALTRVRAFQADGLSASPGAYDLASMNFVAEGATEDHTEFSALCLAFVRSVRSGGHLVAAFMENLGRYRLVGGAQWPAYPVDADVIRDVFRAHTDDLVIGRIDPDPTLPEYGYTGMVLLTARRAAGS
jgi:hypothetical protein